MRAFAVIAVAIGTALVAPVAHATYPVDEFVVTGPTGAVGPGSEFPAGVNDCIDGETVTFVIVGTAESASATCVGTSFSKPSANKAGTEQQQVGNGTASVMLTAPTVPGRYRIDATGSISQRTVSTEFVVAGSTLPRTGSDSNSLLRGGLIASAFGAALVGVAAIRRRKPRLA